MLRALNPCSECIAIRATSEYLIQLSVSVYRQNILFALKNIKLVLKIIYFHTRDHEYKI